MAWRWGSTGLMGKQNMYDHSLHIPCILRGPGFPAGRRSSRLLQHMDVFPTLCEVADVRPPAGLEGESLRQGWGHPDADSSILSAYKFYQRCVMRANMKLIHHYAEEDGHWKLPMNSCLTCSPIRLKSGIWPTIRDSKPKSATCVQR